ncbi:MAG: hypothetical protein QOJ41_1010, partial [Acidobacteriaceae bacterium]|nr:hypothetical protein [Acidobacteriaceae bacterium]
MRKNENIDAKLHGVTDKLHHEHHHEHGDAHDHDHDAVNNADGSDSNVMHVHPLDLAAVREKLKSKTGKQYWRTLEELGDDPQFEQLLHREFPRQASEWDESVDRRDFLKLMAASLAFAGLSGCGKAPEEHIIPYVTQPEGLVLGKPQYYATAMPFGADAIGVLVESHEGRPTNIQGNPDHPSSRGAVDSFVQASILDLYDPDRAQVPTQLGAISSLSAFRDAAQATAAAMRTLNGEGFRILTGTITSPLVSGQIQALAKLYPKTKWHQWEPAGNDGAREGSRMAFGRYVNTVYRPEKAEVILSLDADFMAEGPGHIRYMKEFYRRRKLENESSEMNRLYVVEPTPSVTGASADHHLPLRSSDVGLFTRALAAKIGLGGTAEMPSAAQHWLETVRGELQAHRAACLVIPGEHQPAEIHALAHAMNAALGNVGHTVYYTDPVEATPVNQLESLRTLCDDMAAGSVDTLLIVGGNPVYDAPHDFDFANKLKKVRNIIHLSSHFDETAEYCQWHIPESHYLEAWGDARAFDGTLSIVQPLIAPLYNTISAYEFLAAFSDKPGVTAYDAMRERLKTLHGGPDFEKFWRKSLHDGVIANTASNPSTVASAATLPATNPVSTDALEFIFRPDPCVYDGRFANNGWLQELP